ncbi:MAG: cytochrome b N-terminal domain-containing protein [Halobacteriales archaeon]|nr:cytochrome b N-terminal domain-containing protein [Halobacteriales archaeon]
MDLRRAWHSPVAGQAARAPWALGLATLLLLGLAALTGLLLAVGFDPARMPEAVRGNLARGAHAWSASAAVVLVLAHVARVGWTRAYRGARVRTWWLGLSALGALLALFWLGTALRGDQQGFEAWRHASEVLGLLRIGAPASPPGDALFLLHVLGVPALLLAAVALHVRRVRRLDLAPRQPAEPSVPFARHARAALRIACAVAALVLLAGWLAPPALGPAPLPQLEAARAPWPFAWLVPWQDALGTWGIPLGLAVLFGGLAALPRLDRASPRAARALLALLLGMVVLLALVALLGPQPVRILG